jgi:glycosyltransferase involved in cell wall biosynthesis
MSAHRIDAARSPLRILHLAGTSNGAAWVHEQVRDLRARGHDARAIIGGADGTLAARLAADGIPFEVADLDVFARNMPLAAARILKVARLLRRLRPDVVQYHIYGSIILGRLAAWLADVPVRLSMIPGPYYLECPGLGELDVLTAPLDTKVIASCEYTRTLYERAGIQRTHVDLIYYGQDTARFDPALADPGRVRRELGIAPTQPVVGIVAYFYPPAPDGPFTPPHLVNRGIKGHEVLLDAVPAVLAQVPDTVFLLVGGGWGPEGEAYQRRLEARAEALGIAHAVRFTGPRSDIPDTLAAFDVSVQCSLNENLGGSIESLLMARPLVVSAVGGLVDAVIDERTGLLVPPGDAPALAQAITRLLRDRALASQLGLEGRRHALSLLTLEKTIANLDSLYRREVNARSDTTGYRWHRTARRAAWLGLNGWRLFKPLKREVTQYQRRVSAGAP